MKWQTGFEYAHDVIKGNIEVCKNIQLACQRFINFYEDKAWEYEFIPEYVDHVLKFVSFLKHTKGPDALKPIELQPFQIMLLCAIYGFRHKKDHEKRMTTDVIVFIPRKAGKSTLTAVIGLYELAFNEAGAEVFTLATNREQASIVFDAARAMVESLPAEVRAVYRLSKYEIGLTNDSQTIFRALSRDNKKSGDGKNASCSIIDEAAQILDRNSIEVIHSGMVARKNPLRIYITTASFTKDTKFYEDMSAFEAMLHGDAPDNPHWFGLLYSLDPQDDWRDEKTWAKANPMHGISVYQEAIKERCAQAALKPASLNEFLCKTLNIYVSANVAWIDRQYWDDSIGQEPQDEPEAVFIGFDLAATRDLNAVCTLKRYAEDNYHAHFKFFLPEDALDLIPSHYSGIFDQAVKSGILHITEGNVMDDREISEYIKQQAQQYPQLKEVGYDAYNAASLVARLYDNSIPVKKVGQGMAVLSNPSKHIEKLIMNHVIKHDGNPFLGWQLSNCEIYTDVNSNIKIRKNESDKSAKVDGIIALIIAMHCSLDNPLISTSYGFRSF
jgi:phage terminase large subunit-like protein